MSRSSHLLLSMLFCFLLAVSFLTPRTRSQSTLRSLSLNGTTASVDVPNSSSLNLTGPITVEAWIKYNAIDGTNHDIVSRINRNEAGSGGGYSLTVNAAGKLRLDLFQSHNSYTTVIGATVMSTGTWHHVAGVFSGSQMRVYVDGVLDGSLNTTNAPGSGTSLLGIGKAAHAANAPPLYLPSFAFAGLIDEVRVSAAALYTSNFTPGLGPGSNVAGLWKFDGQTANDFSGTGNNGTLQGGATYSTDVPPVTNSAPSVSLTHPLNNTSLAAGSNVVMDATASDSDGSVTKVDFYQGTTLLGTDTTAPYTYIWTNVAAGTYSLTAKATDDANATTTSSAIAVTVIAPGGYHSLSLNGTTASVDVPNSSSLNITGPITVEAWIKYNAIDGTNHDIVSRINRNEAGSGGGYSLTVNAAGKLRLDLFQSHNSYTTVIGATVMSTGVWHHVAGVFSGSQMRVYVDGVLDGSLNTTNAPGSGTSLLRIGKAAHAANAPPLYLPSFAFAGLIDEVRVSAAALYASNFTPGLGPGSNVAGLWKFDGQTANDFSGTGNNGTLQGGATYSTDVPPTGGGSQRPVPVANGPYSGQLAQAVQFSSSGSTDPDGTIASYHWNFGDGTSANTANPSHTYAAPGLYTATLTATDSSGLLASATATVTISSSGNARLDPLNQTGGSGENPLSRNFNWTLPLVGLPGRAGMDLGLSLSYNSLVWTKTGNYISFDEDHGFPGPGFRLGFPVIQPLYYNAEVGKYAFLLIGNDGSRIELRRVGSSALYEAADSSYPLLDANTMVLRATDGSQLKYELKGSEYQCTEIKDRNGNYLTVNYTPAGRIDTIIDTLARSIKFNYDTNGWLTSITQVWNQGMPSQVTHNWATFQYTNTIIQTNFTNLTVSGPSNNSTIKTLSKVTLADGSHYDFSYTSWGQVWKVSNFAADNHLLNYRAYNLPLDATGSQTDCPRFTERRDWTENWNQNVSGMEQEVITTFAAPVTASWTMPDGASQSGMRAEVTTPDGTVNKIYFIGTAGTASGWQRGLPALVETYSGGEWQRKVMTTWTQDNTSVSYPLNPRVTESNVYDPAGNRKRVQMTYQQVTFANGTSCWLPRDVYEYAANATTVLRSTRTDYHTNTAYTDRRIIGLITEKRLYEGDINSGGVLMSKVGFFYDNENGATSIQGNDAPVQHDNTNYSASFVTGRANLSSIRRYDVTNTAQFTTTRSKYNTAGAVVSTTDASNHAAQISYTDSFSDGVSRNTLAYPTTFTDPDTYTSTTKYNFDFGAVTYRRTPQPNTTQNLPGPEQTLTYDTIGRPQQVTNQVNGAYTRFEYANTMTRVDSYATIQDGLGEAHSFKFSDGAGRVIATATQHPGSIGGYSGQRFVYDAMGRVTKTSNPTETNASGSPLQWVAAGDDAAAGWIYTEQTYDWKGRPLVTTNQDGITKTASYAGCGCAGGEVVTLTNEGTIDGGVAKRRQQKIYSDVFGRIVKTEILNWEGGTVYSATVNSCNARDQITQIRQYAGAEGSGTYQDSTMTYDGYGRPGTRHVPEQDAGTATVWTYNADDTVNTVTDARGAATTYGYNARHLVTSLTHSAPAGVTPTANASFSYDAAGNRTSMTDGVGSRFYAYNQLSRLTSETTNFTGLTGSYTLTYEYNLAGALTSLAEPSQFGAVVSYTYDITGRLTAVTGSGGLSAQLLTGMQYRAWGALKRADYGDGPQLNVTYNARLLPTRYEMTNVYLSDLIYPGYYTVGTENDYHADGRLRYARDLQDGNFDRAFAFDHAGRLKEAYTGREASGLLPNNPADSPYRQTYNYDVWNNMGRSGRHWTAPVSDTPTYVNNRRTDWSYNANGDVTSRDQGQRTHAYDVVGQQRNFYEEGLDAFSGGYWISHQYSINQTYDADGNVGKRSETRHSEDENGPLEDSTETTYQLRSSVLGGALILEIDQWGGRRGHVYASGELLADYQYSPNTITTIRHRNPTTGQWVKNAVRTELDPLGADVGYINPYVYNMTYSDIMGSDNLYYQRGNALDIRGGCALGMGCRSPALNYRSEWNAARSNRSTLIRNLRKAGHA